MPNLIRSKHDLNSAFVAGVNHKRYDSTEPS